MPQLFTAGLSTETSSFSPMPTGLCRDPMAVRICTETGGGRHVRLIGPA